MTNTILNEINDVTDFSGFLKQVEKFDRQKPHVLLFRGQATAAPLLPSIARKDPTYNSTPTEISMLSELKRRGSFIANLRQMDDWELIVFAQHHEMKTRLLDWSSNPLSALWFACAPEYLMEQDSYVYVLTGPEELEAKPGEDKGQIGKGPFEIGKTKVYRPTLNNARIIAQSGWFTIHHFSDTNQCFVPIDENKKFENQIWRIKIPAASKEGILESLSRCGVRSSTIFPDIVGLCHHMNWKFRNVKDNYNPA